MLSKFTVSNFLSFDEEQVFSMTAGKARTHIDRLVTQNNQKLLKFMAIYGSNASGKSNLVNAFGFARNTIVSGIPKGVGDLYCRLNSENAKRPSRFEFNIVMAGEEYIYGFEMFISEGRFLKEYLIRVRSKSKKTIFCRDMMTGAYEVDTYFKNFTINERLRIYAEDVKNDGSILFLRLMNQNKDSLYLSPSPVYIYKDLYNWFKYNLSINDPDNPITNYSYLIDGDAVNQIGDLLLAFGTGVTKFNLIDVSADKVSAKIPQKLLNQIYEDLSEQKNYRDSQAERTSPVIMLRSDDNSMYIIELPGETLTFKTLEFQHANTSAAFSADEESDGTVRLLDLIEILLSKSTDKVYIVDEINRRFHPLLTYRFVEQYLKMASERDIQLIVTTHESKLMDLDLLRKDEICFVDKNEDGKSTIYSLDDFNDRFDKKVVRDYLDGRYGAIPKFQFRV